MNNKISYSSILTKKSNTLNPKLWRSLPDDIKSMVGIYLPSNLFITLKYLIQSFYSYINDDDVIENLYKSYLTHIVFNRYKSSKDFKIDILKILMDPKSDYSIWNIAINSSIFLTANVNNNYTLLFYGYVNFVDGSYFNWIKNKEKQYRDRLSRETPWHKYCKISRDISILNLQKVEISVYNNKDEFLYKMNLINYINNKEKKLGESMTLNILKYLVKIGRNNDNKVRESLFGHF